MTTTPVPVSEDEVHAFADLIEHVQTQWEADRDQYSEPLAEYTARALIAAGYRLPEEPKLQYGVRAVLNRAIVRSATEPSAREAASLFPATVVARRPHARDTPWPVDRCPRRTRIAW